MPEDSQEFTLNDPFKTEQDDSDSPAVEASEGRAGSSPAADEPDGQGGARPGYLLDRPVKVLIAPVEIGHNSIHLRNGLKRYNVEVDIIDVFRGGPRREDHTTVSAAVLQDLRDDPVGAVRRLARQYNLIYFQFGCSLADHEYIGGPRLGRSYPDLEIIRDQGAKIAAAYWGSDLWDPAMFVDNALRAMGFELDKAPESSKYKQAKLERMSSQAAFILSVDEYAHLFPKLVNSDTPIDLGNWPFQPRNFDRRRLKIAHMPSNRYKKNSDLVLEVFELLKETGLAEPVLIENVPHRRIPEILGQCDLFVDQMVRGFGKASIEAMALGLPVFTRTHGPIAGRRGRAPVFTFRNKFDFLGRLIYLNRNREMLRRASVQGRDYVEACNSVESISRDIYAYLSKAVQGQTIDHLTTDRGKRLAMFQTRFYEQALPILNQIGDHRRMLEVCRSGLENGVSTDVCLRFLKVLEQKGLVRIGRPRPAAAQAQAVA